MAKARVTIPFQQTPAQSSSINDLVTDYITRGQLILSSQGAVLRTTTTGATVVTPRTAGVPWYLGWYPYNPAKQIYDRMDILFNHATGAGLATDLHLQYSLNSGSTWTSANPGQAASTLAMDLPIGISTGSILGASSRTVDLSGIAAFAYLGFRYLPDVTDEARTWVVTAFLYLSSETPF